jgi:mannose-6-phosphate isomerase-like protein (cupin superfamily)
VTSLHESHTDFTTDTCHYTPIFGEGDALATVPKAIARFGEIVVDPHGSCSKISYPRQEEIYFVLKGNGTLNSGDSTQSLAENDFTYVAPGAPHSIGNTGDQPLRLVIATVKVAASVSIEAPASPPIANPPIASPVVANLRELKEQQVGGHPASVMYKLMIGPRKTARDRINATYAVADFFLMDFAPGGTNFPHHHEVAEEIYLVLDGEGQMAAGGGMDGVEGLHPAKAGDAYYFRQNCTVGFYNQNKPDAKAHILALRVYVPLPKDLD